MFNLPKLIDCNLAVIGLGYVGLPLALEFANRRYSCINKKILKRNILGFDISEKRIRELKKGNDLTNESDLKKIGNLDNLEFTTETFK